MTLQQLKYVVTISKTLNISKAAEMLFLSQPSLTKAVNELEREMNIKIFVRSNKGVTVTREGDLFLAHARQVLEQAEYMEETFKGGSFANPEFSVSCQHYVFAVKAMAETIKAYDVSNYNFTLRETQTREIIEDVRSLRSEIGILYLSSQNEEIMTNIIKRNGLEFNELVTVKPHVFLYKKHPLATKKLLKLADLDDYPYLCFEQGEYNSFYYSEEILSTVSRRKVIRVRDRATMSNLIVELNGYTVCSGLSGNPADNMEMIAKPLDEVEYMKIGYIKKKDMPLGPYAQTYIEHLKENCMEL